MLNVHAGVCTCTSIASDSCVYACMHVQSFKLYMILTVSSAV